MANSSPKLRLVPMIAILVVISIMLGSRFAISQTQDTGTLSFQAFSGLADVYRSGGQAPDLVAKLNTAVELVREAHIARSQGDEANALRLDEQARTMLVEIAAKIPSAQAEADRANGTRTLTAFFLMPFFVAISTLAFYGALRAWRGYEKMKLYEMRIVEKKKE